MMKKVLVLLLVLGMVSVASAALQISVNGDPEPVDSQITLAPSDEVILDLWNNADGTPFEQVTYALVVAGGPGTISGGDAIIGSILGPVPGTPGITAPGAGIAGQYLLGFSGLPPAGTVYVDGILFHCDDVGEVQIELWSLVDVDPGSGDDFQPDQLLDALTIHQVPEPATICLLGLGGLALLRRRK